MKKNKMDLNEWIHELKYLPSPLEDFHDQKDVFKSLEEWIKWKDGEKNQYYVDWIKGQIYVLDYFLKFMACHGYTLQRSRKKLKNGFCNLSETIKARQDKETEIFREYLKTIRV